MEFYFESVNRGLKFVNSTVIQSMSVARFDTYLRATGHDLNRAFELYVWNARLGAAFQLPIQSIEVCLRNRVSTAMVAEFGPNWWVNARFKTVIEHERQRDIDTVLTRIRHKGLVAHGDQIVASLSFGFWVSMLDRRYNPTIWGRHLRATFPSMPVSIDRERLRRRCSEVARFRNRISHHEPIFNKDASKSNSEFLELLSWLCPETQKWITPMSDVPRLLRQKP
jgi:Abi-like protein